MNKKDDIVIIDDDSLAELKELAKSNIIEVVTSRVQLNKRNKCACPYPHHNEDTASFNVFTTRGDGKGGNTFCFGCRTQADAIEFIKLMDNCTFTEASETVAKILNFNLKYKDTSNFVSNKNRIEWVGLEEKKTAILNANYLYISIGSKATIEDNHLTISLNKGVNSLSKYLILKLKNLRLDIIHFNDVGKSDTVISYAIDLIGEGIECMIQGHEAVDYILGNGQEWQKRKLIGKLSPLLQDAYTN